MSDEQVLNDGPVMQPRLLWERALGGNFKPTTEERRAILMWLDTEGAVIATDDHPDGAKGFRTSYTAYKLGEILGVSQQQISKDRAIIRQKVKDALSPEQALDYVSDYLREHEMLIRRAEDGLAQCAPGSQNQIMFLRLLSDLRKRHMALLQEVAVVPKELGNLNVTEEIWEAEVSKDGITSVHRVEIEKALSDGDTASADVADAVDGEPVPEIIY